MKTRRHVAVTNEKNPKDHVGRAKRKVHDEVNKGSVPKPMPRQKAMGRIKPVITGKKSK